MEILVKKDNQLVFELNGRLDTLTAPELEQKIKDENVNEDLILDFKNLEYISSAGLRVLLSTKKLLNSKGKELTITNINDVVKEVFNVTGFINILNIK